jgi:glycosyltransferase involved in cell wall biosynthesis
VCGFANALIFSSNRYAWKTRSFIDQALVRMKCLYKRKMMVRDNVDVFITETNSMADSIRRTYPGKDVFVVANNCGEAFYTAPNVAKSALMPDKVGGEFRIVTLSQYYPHKNLELVPRVASILCKKIKGRNPVFFLPLAEESKGWKRIRQLARRFGVASHVRTVGPVNPANAPMFYTGADAMLLPSVLETFSANYPEAMICGVPIVTTDLPFARDICGDAAVFFRPMDAVDAAIKIKALVENHNLRNNLVINGYKRLKLFPTPEEKARLYLDACRSMWMKAKS